MARAVLVVMIIVGAVSDLLIEQIHEERQQ